jgi:wyosine [tRNA(Phe)-imidazoG37] synthetase (radical SAM superfamily)
MGRSLGINTIGDKTCSYACVYCQVGNTPNKQFKPRHFISPAQVREAVARHIEKLRGENSRIDYLTFVPDGEPTLDLALGESIEALREFDIPIAVITNASLLWLEEVRLRLFAADLVSIKLDSVEETAWRRINRPHPQLRLDTVLHGIVEFAGRYPGSLISETMLLAGENDGEDAVTAIADCLACVSPETAYLAVPTRPPAVARFRGSDERRLIRAHSIFAERLERVELLTGNEVGPFAHTGDARTDLLAITAVHPMRESAVRELLSGNHCSWGLVDELVADGDLNVVEYDGDRFYLRPVRRR